MNRDNITGVQMWRDDEVITHSSGTKDTEERWFVKSMCSEHSEKIMGETMTLNPAYVILKMRPYHDVVFLDCIESQYTNPHYGGLIDCKNTKCPFYEQDAKRNQTSYIIR